MIYTNAQLQRQYKFKLAVEVFLMLFFTAGITASLYTIIAHDSHIITLGILVALYVYGLIRSAKDALRYSKLIDALILLAEPDDSDETT